VNGAIVAQAPEASSTVGGNASVIGAVQALGFNLGANTLASMER